MDFFKENSKEIRSELKDLSEDERLIAMAIVAPEVSQYSSVMDFLELRTLFIMYRNMGSGDFSVGKFQMKPSFVELIEKEISKDNKLKKQFNSYIPTGDEKEKRTTRLKRLSELEWQLKYLRVFIDLARKKTKNVKFKTSEDKLRYWATLYNSGLNIGSDKVKRMMSEQHFPHYSRKKFNYADVAVEFYKALKK